MLMNFKYRASISALAISLTCASSSVVGVKNTPFKDNTTLSKRFLEETSEDTQTKRPRLSGMFAQVELSGTAEQELNSARSLVPL